MERTRLLWKVFFLFGFLYLTPSFQLLEGCCSETEFPKQRLAFSDFSDDKFSGQFLFAVRIVTLDLRYYLLVDLRLSSPVFGTCSVELTKNVVSDVVQRLSTFASLGLSSLERTFLIAEDPILTPCDNSPIFFIRHDDVFQPFTPGLDIPIDLIVTFLPPRDLLSWLLRIRLPWRPPKSHDQYYC